MCVLAERRSWKTEMNYGMYRIRSNINALNRTQLNLSAVLMSPYSKYLFAFSLLQYLFQDLLANRRHYFYGDRVVRLVFRSLAISAEGYASQSLGVLLFYVTDFPIKYRASTFTVRLAVKCYPARKCASWDASSLVLHRCMTYKWDMHTYSYHHMLRNCPCISRMSSPLERVLD